ncbi:TniQ family protein [Cereibacter azotoformans]|uniref:TniQ family protein n=1 Tax=Cereibacter azotoformans TaxID=43057 RepID=UPI001EECA0CF|nr:TniQ family protein [Cereibacter azotoformans]ULB10230.1 TniQ family protein [Cereibacter azotoformans]
MKPAPLFPALPFHDDEVTQGYFARIGRLHAGVDVGRFCRYTSLPPSDFRNGADAVLDTTAALAGLDPERLGHNLLRRLDEDRYLLRGETLAVTVLRRTTVRFCPQCLADDRACDPGLGPGAERLRWSWLLRPVVSCPVHQTVLVECPEPDAVKAFDLTLLRARNEALLHGLPPAIHHVPGALQTYVVARLEGLRDAAAWLDGQPITQAVKACEMLGSLVADGPLAEINAYTDLDWARVGDVGFGICAGGAEAITAALTAIRQSSGRRSGRTGPQAVFGKFFLWLEYTARAADAGPIRDLLRETILNSFAIGPGETVLGEVVDRRRVHSVNSLKAATGLNPKRLYRLMQKAGMIPADSDAEALNQWVFPAEEGERLIGRILNSLPQNQIRTVLGCSRTQAEQLAAAGMVRSVVPVADGGIGLSVGAYNRDDLAEFLACLCAEVPVVAETPEGFLDLTLAAKGRSSTVEILRWQLEGQLRKTHRIGASHRIDGLRFCLDEIRTLVRARSRTDLHRLTVVAIRLGVQLEVVKRLVSADGGAPLLALVPPQQCRGLQGRAYVSTAEIERFKADYLTLGRAAEVIGMHPLSARVLLDGALAPVRDPAVLGVRLYRRHDVEAFLTRSGAPVGVQADLHEGAFDGTKTVAIPAETAEMAAFGETDGSTR